VVAGTAIWRGVNLTPVRLEPPKGAATPSLDASPSPEESQFRIGKWFPIRPQVGDRIADIVITKEGIYNVHHGVGLGFRAKDCAIRAHLRRPKGVQFSGLEARTNGAHRLALIFSADHAWLDEFGAPPTPDALPLQPEDGVDKPVSLQLAVVGEYAYGWVNGKMLPTYHCKRPPDIGGFAFWSQDGEFSNVDVLILDGLPEDQMRKILEIQAGSGTQKVIVGTPANTL
jgi:hypothetical protein